MTTNYLTVAPPEESDAMRRADRLIEETDTLGQEVLEAFEDPRLREAIHVLVHGLASGRSVRIEIRPDNDYSPQAAADALGISRKLVNKLIETGEVKSYRLPGSSYVKVPVSEVDRLLEERELMRSGIDSTVDELLDAGAEY